MKTTFQAFRLTMRKSLAFIACLTIGLASFTICDAQSIVGKWKGVSVKNYFSAEYAKQMGKSEEEKFEKDGGSSEIDYNADHSFKLIFYETNSSEATIMKGTWSVVGDQLTLTLEPQFNPKGISTKANFTVDGNTMVTTAVIAPPTRIIKSVSTATRM